MASFGHRGVTEPPSSSRADRPGLDRRLELFMRATNSNLQTPLAPSTTFVSRGEEFPPTPPSSQPTPTRRKSLAKTQQPSPLSSQPPPSSSQKKQNYPPKTFGPSHVPFKGSKKEASQRGSPSPIRGKLQSKKRSEPEGIPESSKAKRSKAGNSVQPGKSKTPFISPPSSDLGNSMNHASDQGFPHSVDFDEYIEEEPASADDFPQSKTPASSFDMPPPPLPRHRTELHENVHSDVDSDAEKRSSTTAKPRLRKRPNMYVVLEDDNDDWMNDSLLPSVERDPSVALENRQPSAKSDPNHADESEGSNDVLEEDYAYDHIDADYHDWDEDEVVTHVRPATRSVARPHRNPPRGRLPWKAFPNASDQGLRPGEFYVKRVSGMRIGGGRQIEYLIDWTHHHRQKQWIPKDACDCQDAIDKYQRHFEEAILAACREMRTVDRDRLLRLGELSGMELSQAVIPNIPSWRHLRRDDKGRFAGKGTPNIRMEFRKDSTVPPGVREGTAMPPPVDERHYVNAPGGNGHPDGDELFHILDNSRDGSSPAGPALSPFPMADEDEAGMIDFNGESQDDLDGEHDSASDSDSDSDSNVINGDHLVFSDEEVDGEIQNNNHGNAAAAEKCHQAADEQAAQEPKALKKIAGNADQKRVAEENLRRAIEQKQEQFDKKNAEANKVKAEADRVKAEVEACKVQLMALEHSKTERELAGREKQKRDDATAAAQEWQERMKAVEEKQAKHRAKQQPLLIESVYRGCTGYQRPPAAIRSAEEETRAPEALNISSQLTKQVVRKESSRPSDSPKLQDNGHMGAVPQPQQSHSRNIYDVPDDEESPSITRNISSRQQGQRRSKTVIPSRAQEVSQQIKDNKDNKDNKNNDDEDRDVPASKPHYRQETMVVSRHVDVATPTTMTHPNPRLGPLFDKHVGQPSNGSSSIRILTQVAGINRSRGPRVPRFSRDASVASTASNSTGLQNALRREARENNRATPTNEIRPAFRNYLAPDHIKKNGRLHATSSSNPKGNGSSSKSKRKHQGGQ